MPTIRNEEEYYRLKEKYMAKNRDYFDVAYDKKGRLKEEYMAKKKAKAKKKTKKKKTKKKKRK